MLSRFRPRQLAAAALVAAGSFVALVVAVVIIADSGDGSDDDRRVFPPTEASASPSESPVATREPAPSPTPQATVTVAPTAPPVASAERPTLTAALEAIRADTGAPAVAAAAFSSDGTILDAAAVGVRRSGEATPVTVDDPFHLGSDVKAMTATLLVRLEEHGAPVSLDTTLGEAFPGWAIDEGYAAVTLRQLLSHTAGIDDAVELDLDETWLFLPVEEQRAAATQLLLELPPALEPGTLSRYSNLGYVVAGAALEQATGQSWEALMQAEVFDPLGMDSCGFGAPGADGSDAPWGHDASGEAVDPTRPDFDLTRLPFINPAGGVYCSMADWTAFLSEMLRGLAGESDYVSAASVEQLFTPADAPYERDPNAGYALGWLVYDTPFGRAYAHDGTNFLWYASAWLAPELDRGLIAVSNGAGPTGPGGEAARAAIAALIERYPIEP